MPHKMETPPAGDTANGANLKASEASMREYLNRPAAATLSPLRAAHIARLLGDSDQAAATIASVCLVGAAS